MLEVKPREHLAPQPLPSIKTYSNIKNSFVPCDILKVMREKKMKKRACTFLIFETPTFCK
jgi:hypothetical protein